MRHGGPLHAFADPAGPFRHLLAALVGSGAAGDGYAGTRHQRFPLGREEGPQSRPGDIVQPFVQGQVIEIGGIVI